MPYVALSGWVPDADANAPGIILECSNLIPTVRGMQAAPGSTQSQLDALADAVLGAALVVNLSGSATSYAGTTDALYKAGASSWTDVSRAVAYGASTDTRWRFAQFGDTTIAAQKADWVQASTGSDFDDVKLSSAYAPKAALVEVVEGFVMLADCNDTGAGLGTSYGDQGNRWWCSGIYDYQDWTPATATQCTTGLLVASQGKITGLKRLGSNVVAYKDDSLYLGTYVGAPAVWQWNLIPGEAGCASNEAIANTGDAHFFVGKSDFYGFDGTRPVPIGDGIREFFFTQLNANYAYKITALHDKSSANVWWFYPRGSSSECNASVIYNYKSKKWGRCDLNVETVVQYSAGGVAYSWLSEYTYETFPAVTYDSPFWGSGGSSLMSYFDTSHQLQHLTGVASSTSLTTSYFGSDDEFSTVRRVRPRYLVAPAGATLTPAYRDVSGVQPHSLSAMSQVTGRFDYLQSARWHRFKLDTSGQMELTGLDIDAVSSGSE